jgi:flagellar biosynthesis protein FlhG
VKSLSEQSHYDVLEIEPGADAEEVERAYRIARATYTDASLATYSMFEDEEARAVRERIELAYEVLSDPAARGRYDETLHDGGNGAAPEPLLLDDPLALPPVDPTPDRVAPRAEAPAEIDGFEDVDDGGEGAWDGPRLRRARMLRGIDLDRIAAITKIKPLHLESLEQERFDRLPNAVYVRGYVFAYARCLGLDAPHVALSYLERMRPPPEEPRSRWARG